MGTETDIEKMFKELQQKNQDNANANLKAQVQAEEAIKRIEKLLSNSTVKLDINLELLKDRQYVNDLIIQLDTDIKKLETEFIGKLKTAKEALNSENYS